MQRFAALSLALLFALSGCAAPFGPGPADVGDGGRSPGATGATPPPGSGAPDPTTASPTGQRATGSAPTGAGPSTPSESTPTATRTPAARDPARLAATYDVPVENGTLPTSYSLVLARTQVLLGSEASPPLFVRVKPESEMGFGRRSYPPFYRALGVTVPEGRDEPLTAAAYVTGRNDGTRLFVNEKMLDRPAELEATLAHESVHVVQFNTTRSERLYRGVDPDGERTTDERYVIRGVLEGAATYVETVYWRRYVREGENPQAALDALYRNETRAARLGVAPYRFGGHYVAARVDDPTHLERVYDRPPRTTEQLIHRLPPGSEPPARLAVRSAGGWEEAREKRDRFGELFVRVTLATELPESRAAAGADGWGADRRLVFDRGDRRGYAWALRWDDPANATEFVDTFGTYLDRRATREGKRWRDDGDAFRVVRVGDETTVVLLGDPGFVRETTVSGSEADVTVRAPA